MPATVAAGRLGRENRPRTSLATESIITCLCNMLCALVHKRSNCLRGSKSYYFLSTHARCSYRTGSGEFTAILSGMVDPAHVMDVANSILANLKHLLSKPREFFNKQIKQPDREAKVILGYMARKDPTIYVKNHDGLSRSIYRPMSSFSCSEANL